MFEFKLMLNGKPYRSSDFKNLMERAMYESVVEHIKKTVGNVRCPEHGKFSKITASGTSLSSLKFNVSGCCEKLKEAVTQKLKK